MQRVISVGYGCALKDAPFAPAEAGAQFFGQALGPRFRGDERSGILMRPKPLNDRLSF